MATFQVDRVGGRECGDCGRCVWERGAWCRGVQAAGVLAEFTCGLRPSYRCLRMPVYWGFFWMHADHGITDITHVAHALDELTN